MRKTVSEIFPRMRRYIRSAFYVLRQQKNVGGGGKSTPGFRFGVQTLREESDALERELNSWPDDREIEKLARERLGLVMPDETIFYFTNAEDKEG